MGCEESNISFDEKIQILWIDNSIKNKEENKGYAKTLEKNEIIKNVKCVENVKEGIQFLKLLEFKKTLVICSGRLYPDFIKEFKKNINNFMICPKIIIFTGDKINYENRNINNEELEINHPFYNSGGVVDRFNAVLDFLKRNDKINGNYSSLDENNKTNDVEYNFEYITKKNQLILPINFLHYCKQMQEIKEFNERILAKIKNNEIIYLFEQLLDVEQIPHEITSKFWARAYTLNSPFYKIMNKDLRLSNTKDYLIYIQMMYEGVKRNYTEVLFSL